VERQSAHACAGVRLFVWRMDELIDEARGRGLSDEAFADALEDIAGALRQGVS
jgi:hypothetical protein